MDVRLQFGVIINHFSKVTIFAQFFVLIFPFVPWLYAHPSPLYFFQVSRHEDLIIISSKSSTWQGNPLSGALFVLAHFRTFHPIIRTHLTCVFFLLANDMHIIGLTLYMVPFFMIAVEVFNIRAFNTTNEMCSLVSIGVGPLYFTSFWFFYSQLGFLYFGHINGIHIICWIICGLSSSHGSWEKI
jgi:hypothetical protein